MSRWKRRSPTTSRRRSRRPGSKPRARGPAHEGPGQGVVGLSEGGELLPAALRPRDEVAVPLDEQAGESERDRGEAVEGGGFGRRKVDASLAQRHGGLLAPAS